MEQQIQSYVLCTAAVTVLQHCTGLSELACNICILCRADAVTDLDEGAAPSDPIQGPAEGQSEADPDGHPAPEPAGKKEAEDPSAFLRQEGEAADVYARRIFERVYGHDIERVLRMEVRLQASALSWHNVNTHLSY